MRSVRPHAHADARLSRRANRAGFAKNRFGDMYRDIMRAVGTHEGSVLVRTADCCVCYGRKRGLSEPPLPVVRNCRAQTDGLGSHSIVWPSLRIIAKLSLPQWLAIAEAGLPPWERRTPRAVWRGGWNGVGKKLPHRMIAVARYQDHPLFDVGFGNASDDEAVRATCQAAAAAITPRATPADTDADARAKCERTLHGLHARGRLTIIEQSRYQAILVLPGNGAASAMSWIFASGSTALIPHPMAEEVCACHVDVPRGHAPPNASRSSPLPLLFSSFRFGARH